MNDAQFEEAAGALRQFGAERPPAPAVARARRRTLAAMTRNPRRQMRRAIFAFALVLLGTTAWAQISMWRARSGAPRTAAATALRAETRTPAPAPAEQFGPRPPASPPIAAEASAPTPVIAGTPAPHTPNEMSLYRRAHRMHFDGARPDSVITAWDAYLRAYPRGMFAPEARYNRAISMLRAERFRDALAALEPFACQAEGGYRRSEARVLARRVRERAPELAALSCMNELP